MEHNRNSLWFTSSTFTVIALVAITSSMVGNISDQEKAVKWAVSAISVNIGLSGLAVIAIIALKNKFVGTMMEGGLALLTTGLWAAVMPAINDTDNGLAVSEGNIIDNPNLYFFSWLALLMSFFIFFDFMKHKFLDEDDVSQGEFFQVFSWAGLMATSFVVMANASRLFNDNKCDEDKVLELEDDRCQRTKLAVGIGAISTVVALVWLLLMAFLMGKSYGKFIDFMLVLLNIIIWTCGIAYITFSEKAPANKMGNLYFFTWASFGLTVTMFMSSLKRVMDKGEKAEEETKPKEPERKEGGHKEPESEPEMKGSGEEADVKDVGEETV